LREHGNWLQGCEERLRQHELHQRGTQGEQAELRQHETWMQHQRSVFEQRKETVRRQRQSAHRARGYELRQSRRQQSTPAQSTAIPVATAEPNRGAAGDAPLNRAAQTEAGAAKRAAIWDHYQSEHRLRKAEAAEEAAIVAHNDERQAYLDSKAKLYRHRQESPGAQSAEALALSRQTVQHTIRSGELQEAAKAARTAAAVAAAAELDARGKWLDGTDKPTRAACVQYHEGQLEKAQQAVRATLRRTVGVAEPWGPGKFPLQPQQEYELTDPWDDPVSHPILGCYIRALPEGHTYDLCGETGAGIPLWPRGVNSPPLKSGTGSGGAAGDAPLNQAARTAADAARRAIGDHNHSEHAAKRTAISDHYQSEHRLRKAEAAEEAAIVAHNDETQAYLESKAKYHQHGQRSPGDQSAETLEHIIRGGKLQEAKAARAAAATAELDARGKWLDWTDNPTRAACAQYHEGQLEKAAAAAQATQRAAVPWEPGQLKPQQEYELEDEYREPVSDPILGCYIRILPEGHRYM
jgi:hypothetical protein